MEVNIEAQGGFTQTEIRRQKQPKLQRCETESETDLQLLPPNTSNGEHAENRRIFTALNLKPSSLQGLHTLFTTACSSTTEEAMSETGEAGLRRGDE